MTSRALFTFDNNWINILLVSISWTTVWILSIGTADPPLSVCLPLFRPRLFQMFNRTCLCPSTCLVFVNRFDIHPSRSSQPWILKCRLCLIGPLHSLLTSLSPSAGFAYQLRSEARPFGSLSDQLKRFVHFDIYSNQSNIHPRRLIVCFLFEHGPSAFTLHVNQIVDFTHQLSFIRFNESSQHLLDVCFPAGIFNLHGFYRLFLHLIVSHSACLASRVGLSVERWANSPSGREI